MSELDQRDKSICLDALAMVAAAEAGNREGFELMLSTYQGDEAEKIAERGKLLAAVFGHAVAILRMASREIGFLLTRSSVVSGLNWSANEYVRNAAIPLGESEL